MNFVFVGYDRDDVATEGFLSGLPREYKLVVWSRLPSTESVYAAMMQ